MTILQEYVLQVMTATCQKELDEALEMCEWCMDVDGLVGPFSIETREKSVQWEARYFLMQQPMAMLRTFMEVWKNTR